MRKYRRPSIVTGALLLGLSTNPIIAGTLYMPEGYVGDEIDEFVAILNTSDETAEGEVKIYYQTGESISFPVSFLPKQRTGFSMKDKGVEFDKRFSTVIETDQDITATLIHYDHGTALGANFTSVTDQMWSIAGGGPLADNVRDFLTIFNPNSDEVEVELLIAGQSSPLPKTFNFSIEKQRRHSFHVHEFVVEDEARWQPYGLMLIADAPVVASLSHYDDGLKDGTLMIATPGTGASTGRLNTYGRPTGFVAEGWANDQAFEYVHILNPNEKFNIKVLLTVQYNDGFTETQEIGPITPYQQLPYKVSDHVRKNEGYMLQYKAVSAADCTSNRSLPCSGTTVNAVVNFSHFDNAGLNGVEFKSKGFKHWEFAEGYRNPGRVQEYLLVYNPSNKDAEVTVTFFYDDGQNPTIARLHVEAGKKSGLALHGDEPPLRDREGGIWYGTMIHSTEEIIPYFTHYDLVFGGSFALVGNGRN